MYIGNNLSELLSFVTVITWVEGHFWYRGGHPLMLLLGFT